MPVNGTYSGAPMPADGESPYLPSIFAAYDAVVGQQGNLVATSQSDRDTRYANVKAGTVVTCPSLQKAWMKLTTPPTAASWMTAIEVGAIATSGIVSTTGNWSVSSQWGQRVSGRNLIYLSLAYGGSDIVGSDASATGPGNVADTTMATLQSAWIMAGPPKVTFSIIGPHGGGRGHIRSDTNVVSLADLNTSGRINTGDVIEFSVEYPGA